jgi:hypothetical protein
MATHLHREEREPPVKVSMVDLPLIPVSVEGSMELVVVAQVAAVEMWRQQTMEPVPVAADCLTT